MSLGGGGGSAVALRRPGQGGGSACLRCSSLPRSSSALATTATLTGACSRPSPPTVCGPGEDLQDAVERDLVAHAGFERLMGGRGIGNATVVLPTRI
jgi:hypothetical protein